MMKSSAAVWPPSLKSGSRVALLSPSGPVRSGNDIPQAEQNARDMGWIPVAAANAGNRAGYFAGTDGERRDDLNAALQDDSVDGIWCIRGGYGAIRLLADMDYAAMARTPKALIGYSDVSALHAALSCECEIVSFHGPTARGRHSAFSRASFIRAVVDQADSCGAWPAARTLNSGGVVGKLAGGNLSIVASLVGTPFQIDLEDSILVVEDVNEAVYRIDRMMQQLLLSGSLDGCAGIAAGDFTLPPDDTDSAERPVDEVFSEIAHKLGIPCVMGIPVGHIEDQWTIPLGATGRLDADAKSLNVITPNNSNS